MAYVTDKRQMPTKKAVPDHGAKPPTGELTFNVFVAIFPGLLVAGI
jgi:hypothetical protein